MNKRIVFHILGRIICAVSLLMLLPIAVAVYYKEYGDNRALFSFAAVAVAGYVCGKIMSKVFPATDRTMYAKEGFYIVSIAWIAVSVIGALPFVISGEIPNFTDAFFETVSGFTTTGASVVANVENLSRSMLFWRSFTHFIGGMGVLVFVMAIIPSVSERSIHILRAEMPGPTVDKIVPRATDTAKILYIIYIGLTAFEICMLYFGKLAGIGNMPLFDSVIHSFGTAGTGGFSMKSASIAAYSPYDQWVIGSFMLVFGINFNVFYLLIIKRTVSAFKSSELWTYLSIVLVSVGLIAVNIYNVTNGFSKTARDSFFQVSSIISTTGYATADFDTWPTFSKTILLLLMIIGACGGSTAGGIKVSRVILIFKMIKRKMKSLLQPRVVKTLRVDGKPVDEATVSGVAVYTVVYFVLIVLIMLILALESNFDIESNLSATLACFNNIGPGLSKVGPTLNYASYSVLSKIVLSIAMLLGRLEIFPILLFIIPSSWRKVR
ncbi:MAG TPA: potassium transporter KefA [Ruminococcaceae bacterium]|nr:potassium transporter KefA [Oscillospiraceae bacterium]